jgi:hypothetical protein
LAHIVLQTCLLPNYLKNHHAMNTSDEADVQTCPRDVSNRDLSRCLADFVTDNKLLLEYQALIGFAIQGPGLLFVAIDDLATPSYSWASYQHKYLDRAEIPKLAKLKARLSEDCVSLVRNYDPEEEFVVCLSYQARMIFTAASREKRCLPNLDEQHKICPNANIVNLRQDFLRLMSWSQPFESWPHAQLKDCQENAKSGSDSVLHKYDYLGELPLETMLEFCRPTAKTSPSIGCVASYLKKGKVEIERFLDSAAVSMA